MNLKDDNINKETGLETREQYFLDILFDECGGDFKAAMTSAGYPANHPVGELRRKLSKQIKQASKDYIVSMTPKAAVSLGGVLINPSELGAKNIISAAKEILDRGDVNKEEQKMEAMENVVILLPPKRSESDDSSTMWNKKVDDDEGKTQTSESR